MIYIDDDITTFTFVIESLIKYFDYSVVEAADMAHKIDALGMYVVATLPHCIAEQLAFDVQRDAVVQGYPLCVAIEPEYQSAHNQAGSGCPSVGQGRTVAL